MKSNFANSYVVIFYVSFVKFLARCSPFSVSGYVEEVGCVVFGKFGGVFVIASDTSYFKGSLIVIESDGRELICINLSRRGRFCLIWGVF